MQLNKNGPVGHKNVVHQSRAVGSDHDIRCDINFDLFAKTKQIEINVSELNPGPVWPCTQFEPLQGGYDLRRNLDGRKQLFEVGGP